MRPSLSLLCAALLSCFSEPASPQGDCPPGSAGCDCNAGVCDVGLDCVGGIDKCVPSGCDPGSLACTCGVGDACFDGLVCEEHVCAAAGGSTGAVTATDGSTSATSAPSTDMSSDSGSSEPTGDTTRATMPDESTSMDPATTSADDTGGRNRACIECVANEWGGNGDCGMSTQACIDNVECEAIHTCLLGDPSLVACCSGSSEANEAWNAFAACGAAQCGGVCLDATDASC